MFVVPAQAGTQRLSALPKTYIKSQSHWVPACAGTTDSGTWNFKESFKLTTQLLRSIPVDRIFTRQQCAYTETLYSSEAGQ